MGPWLVLICWGVAHDKARYRACGRAATGMSRLRRVVVVWFRLGGGDGVSAEAAQWTVAQLSAASVASAVLTSRPVPPSRARCVTMPSWSTAA